MPVLRSRTPVLLPILVTCLLMIAGGFAYEIPSWQSEIDKGYFPYHRLVATDFPINDEVHPENGMYTTSFRHYYYQFHWNEENGHITARVTNWLVRSGFDRNKSSRKSWFKPVEQTLPHEQGHLDIGELHSRRFARLTLQELPVGEGTTSQDAAADLKKKLDALCDRVSAAAQAEQDAYDAATGHGKNKTKQAEQTAAIQKRLNQAGISFEN